MFRPVWSAEYRHQRHTHVGEHPDVEHDRVHPVEIVAEEETCNRMMEGCVTFICKGRNFHELYLLIFRVSAKKMRNLCQRKFLFEKYQN